MRLTRLCFCSLAVLAFACAAFGVELKHELYVIQTKPPSVVVVDPERGNVVDSIPVQKDPTDAIIGSRGRFLYVLHEQGGFSKVFAGVQKPLKAARLSIVDLENRRVDRVVHIGTGVNGMQLSRDGRTLFCFADGNNWKWRNEWKPRDSANITTIDTASQKLTNIYRINTPASNLVMTRDGSRLFAFSAGYGRRHLVQNLIGEQMTVFERAQEHPLAYVDLQSHLLSIRFSADQKLLFLLGESRDAKGKAVHEGGTLDVVDVETGKILHAYTVGKDPQQLVRSAHQPGWWIVGKEKIQFISDRGVLNTEQIFLDGEGPSGGAKLNGYPGEALLLSGSKMAIAIAKANGRPARRLALVDLKGQRVVKLVPIGRKAVRARKETTRFALAMGLSVGLGVAGMAAGCPYCTTPYFDPWSLLSGSSGLARSEDGNYFYALDAASNDVTVMKSADGVVAGHIRVDSSSSHLWIPKGGRYLFCLGPKKISVIDTDSNKQIAESKLAGNLVDEEIDHDTSRLYLLANKELDVWDYKNAKQLRSVPGLGHALHIAREGVPTL